jgi:Family of unknown function (DUF5335)
VKIRPSYSFNVSTGHVACRTTWFVVDPKIVMSTGLRGRPMQTIEVAQTDWARALDEFSAIHEGWLVSLEVMGSTLGVQPQIRELPLRGITADSDSRGPAITISAARVNGEHITHIIHAPTHVRIEQTSQGADAALEIESADGTAAILRFRTAALPETVDGMPREG